MNKEENGDSMVKTLTPRPIVKVISFKSNQTNEFEKLLNEGWKMVHSFANDQAFVVVLAKER
jgi:hypothetical protein